MPDPIKQTAEASVSKEILAKLEAIFSRLEALEKALFGAVHEP